MGIVLGTQWYAARIAQRIKSHIVAHNDLLPLAILEHPVQRGIISEVLVVPLLLVLLRLGDASQKDLPGASLISTRR